MSVFGEDGYNGNVVLIRRSDPDAIIAVEADGRKWSLIEDLRERPNHFRRTDIALVNKRAPKHCPTCSCSTWEQYAVFARQLTHDTVELAGPGVAHLSEDETQWCLGEAIALMELAKRYPEFGIYLRGY